MSVNSEYRCRSCREPVRQFFNPNNGKGRTRVGVKHSPTCKLLAYLSQKYPSLVDRIEKERSVA